jgi:predicted RNA binding protein YcfA (HicA-like mRNA interferase family)
VTYREAVRKPRSLGCHELPRRSGGSHRIWHNPATGTAATVPDWGARDLRLGTLRAAIRQLGLDWQDFEQA